MAPENPTTSFLKEADHVPAPESGPNPIRKVSIAFGISFVFLVAVAVVVGVMTSRMRSVSQDIISDELTKMMLIDQISRDASRLHLHVVQFLVNGEGAEEAEIQEELAAPLAS